MKKLFEKYKVFIVEFILILLIGFYIFCPVKITVKKLATNTFALKYDNTWKIKEKSEENIILKHHSGSIMKIEVDSLNDEYSYATIDDLIDEILYSIQKQNKDYKLLFKEAKKITKYEFDGYEILYEYNNSQVMLNIYKESDRIVLISYEAKNDYFDILLDSVENIIYNLDVKDEKFDVRNSIKLITSKIVYGNSKKIDLLLDDSKNYEIANNNYYVKYSIPAIFKSTLLDSRRGSFDFNIENEDKTTNHIYLETSILNRNIYEYLDKDSSGSVYKNYETYKSGDDYSDYKESIDLLKDNYKGYIYKNSYYRKGFSFSDDAENDKEYCEHIELIYALNNSHIFVVKLRSVDVPITEKMVDMIKINSVKNYASFIKIEKQDDNLIGTLQRFSDYKYDKIDKVNLKIPDKYEELDKKENIYLQRNYGFNYNENLFVYDYDVHYELSSMTKEEIIKSINSFGIIKTYGDYKELAYYADLTLNGKQFSVYSGGYTNLSGIMFTNINRVRYYVNKMLLFYDVPNKGCLYVEINGNGKEIDDDVLEELTNFTIE